MLGDQGAALGKQVPIARAHHEFTGTGEGLQYLARLQRQDLVTITVEHQQRSLTEARSHLATGRLGSKRDDPGDHLGQTDTDPDCHRAAETVAHQHDTLGSPADNGQLGSGRDIDATRIDVVRSSVTDSKNGHATAGPPLAESVIQTIGRPEQAAHRAAAGNDRCRRCINAIGNLVPEHRQQSAHREELCVAKRWRDHHVLTRDHSQLVERRRAAFPIGRVLRIISANGGSRHQLYPTTMEQPERPDRHPVDLGLSADLDVAVRLGRAWRELRRGASSTMIRDFFFGVGPDALEYGQMDTLDVLIREPSWRMSDLALALHVDPSTATRAVQRLATTGLVERLTDHDDGRVVIVQITDSGRELHRLVDLRRGYVLSRLMSVFAEDERETLAALMTRFVEELDNVVKDLPRPAIAE